MPIIRKVSKICARCKEPVPSRYRALIDRFVCDPCYPIALAEIAAARDQIGTAPLDEDAVDLAKEPA